MMKKYTLHILLIILCFNLKAQFHSHYRQVELKKTIDECNIAIVYTYKFSLDTIKRTPKYDKQILEIGKTYAKYSSILADKIDSVWYINNKKILKPSRSGADGIVPSKKAGLKQDEQALYEDIYTNYPTTGLITVITIFNKIEYIYEETIPKFEWKIQADTMTVLGYKCIKAITTFRGRTYEVWFTPFIPIRQGPWKFNGLPGLILKVADTKGYFEWVAIGIEKPQNKNIYTYDYSKSPMKKTTIRKDVIKLQHKRWQYPIGLDFATSTTGDLIVITINGKEKEYKRGSVSDFHLPYIPIPELE